MLKNLYHTFINELEYIHKEKNKEIIDERDLTQTLFPYILQKILTYWIIEKSWLLFMKQKIIIYMPIISWTDKLNESRR